MDECKTKNICGPNSKCYNREGSYECECRPGFEKIEPHSLTSKCKDVNECLHESACGANSKCINTEGSYSCTCNDGFIGDPFTGCQSPCAGITCGLHSYCQVHDGTQAACMCDQGFTFDPTNITAGCMDVNECDDSHGPSGLCGQGAVCSNVPGSHHCYCPPGFTGDPFRYCEDIDECSRKFGPYGQCGTSAVCVNTLGSFSCSCKPGYTGDARESCTDIDECSQEYGPNGKCGFSAFCTNSLGSFSCRCPPGTSGDPFKECQPELLCDHSDSCAGNAVCQNGKCTCPLPFVGPECKRKLTELSAAAAAVAAALCLSCLSSCLPACLYIPSILHLPLVRSICSSCPPQRSRESRLYRQFRGWQAVKNHKKGERKE